MRPKLARGWRIEFAVEEKEQLVIGRMGILVRHLYYRVAARASRAKEREREMDTAPSDMLRTSEISR